MADTLRTRLTECFCSVFPNLKPDQVTDASVDSIEAWDSVIAVNLLVAVEQEFCLTIPPDQYDRLSSFKRFLEVLRDAKP